jgi:hypothetical protein
MKRACCSGYYNSCRDLDVGGKAVCLSREYQIPAIPDPKVLKGPSVGRTCKYLYTGCSMGRYNGQLLSICEVQPNSRYNGT